MSAELTKPGPTSPDGKEVKDGLGETLTDGLREAVSGNYDEWKDSGIAETAEEHAYKSASPSLIQLQELDQQGGITDRVHTDFKKSAKMFIHASQLAPDIYEAGINLIDRGPDHDSYIKIYQDRAKKVAENRKSRESHGYDSLVKQCQKRVDTDEDKNTLLQMIKRLNLGKLDLRKLDERRLREWLKIEYPIEAEALGNLTKEDSKKWATSREKNEPQAKLVEIILNEHEKQLQSEQIIFQPRLSSWKEICMAMDKNEQARGAVRIPNPAKGNPKNALVPKFWPSEKACGKREKAQLISIGVDITNIWEIDSAKQVCKADIYVNFAWEINAVKEDIWDPVAQRFNQVVLDVKTRDGKIFQNLISCSYFDNNVSAARSDKPGVTRVNQRITITGTFAQKMDLRNYPFDEQTLEFILVDWLNPYQQPLAQGSKKMYPKRRRRLFIEDPNWQCRVKNSLHPETSNKLGSSDEWALMKWDWQDPNDRYYRAQIDIGLTDPDPKMLRQWPRIVIKCRVHRLSDFIIYTCGLPIALTVIFGLFGNLTANLNEFDRTSFTAALLFTIFSVKSNIPVYALSTVGYQTRLDVFVLISQFITIILGIVGVFFSYRPPNDADADDPLSYGILLWPSAGLGFLYVVVFVQFMKGYHLFPLLSYICCDSDQLDEEN